MRMLVVLVATVAFWVPQSRAASIGLFADPDCVSCDLRIPSTPGAGVFYIAVSGATTAPEYCEGITLAEFRIVGLPLGWEVSLTPYAGTSVVGHPFGAGVNVSFAWPQPGDCVLIYLGTLTPAAPGAEAVLGASAHSTPRNPSWECPVVRPGNCGSAFCVDGGALYVNSTTLCSTTISKTTWERVKQLYQ